MTLILLYITYFNEVLALFGSFISSKVSSYIIALPIMLIIIKNLKFILVKKIYNLTSSLILIFIFLNVILSNYNSYYIKDTYVSAFKIVSVVLVIQYLGFYFSKICCPYKFYNKLIDYSFVYFILTIVFKLISFFFMGVPLVKYTGPTIYFSSLMFLHLIFIRRTDFYKYYFFLFPGFFSLSKTLIISNSFLFLISNKKNFLISMIMVIIFSTYFLDDIDILLSRFMYIIEYLFFGGTLDPSSAARMAEILNAIEIMSSNILQFFTGMGSGALWFDILGLYQGGLSESNFRPNGGVHHIHSGLFLIIFRFGILFLLLYVFYFYSIFKNTPVKFKKLYMYFLIYKIFQSLFVNSIYFDLELVIISGVFYGMYKRGCK